MFLPNVPFDSTELATRQNELNGRKVRPEGHVYTRVYASEEPFMPTGSSSDSNSKPKDHNSFTEAALNIQIPLVQELAISLIDPTETRGPYSSVAGKPQFRTRHSPLVYYRASCVE